MVMYPDISDYMYSTFTRWMHNNLGSGKRDAVILWGHNDLRSF